MGTLLKILIKIFKNMEILYDRHQLIHCRDTSVQNIHSL